MQTILTPKQAEISILKTRLDALEETHAFIAMYYAFRAAQLLDEWRLAEEEAGDEERAKAMHLAYRRVKEMADEFHAKSMLGIGDIT